MWSGGGWLRGDGLEKDRAASRLAPNNKGSDAVLPGETLERQAKPYQNPARATKRYVDGGPLYSAWRERSRTAWEGASGAFADPVSTRSIDPFFLRSKVGRQIALNRAHRNWQMQFAIVIVTAISKERDVEQALIG